VARTIQFGDAVLFLNDQGDWMFAKGAGFPALPFNFISESRPPNGTPFWRTDFRAWYAWDRATEGWILAEAGSETFDKGGNVISPTAPLNLVVWQAPFACVVTKVSGYRVGGTGATVNARRNGVDNHLVSNLSLTSADVWMADEAVQNTNFVEGDKLEIMIVTTAGSPTQVAVLVEFRRS